MPDMTVDRVEGRLGERHLAVVVVDHGRTHERASGFRLGDDHEGDVGAAGDGGRGVDQPVLEVIDRLDGAQGRGGDQPGTEAGRRIAGSIAGVLTAVPLKDDPDLGPMLLGRLVDPQQ